MRGLHVVGMSDDGTQVLLAASPDAARPSHAVPLDGRLRAAVNGDWRTDGKAESALSPKEIQARLRAGDTVEDVAKAAGVPMARVMPFAAPVLSERERVIEDARAAIPRRERGDSPQTTLGPLVDTRLATTTGLKPDTVSWSARRRDDGAWVVTLDYSARGGRRHAEWVWHPTSRQLWATGVAAARLSAPEGDARRAKPKPRAAPKSKAAQKPKAAPKSRSKAAPKPGPTAKAKPQAQARSKAAATTGATPSRPTRRPAKRPQAAPPETVVPPAAAAEPPRPPTAAADAEQVPPARRPVQPATVVPRPASVSWSDVLFGVAESPVVASASGRGAARAHRRRSSAGAPRSGENGTSGTRGSGRRRA